MQERNDSPQRRTRLCGNADENHRVSQSAQYLRGSSDLVS